MVIMILVHGSSKQSTHQLMAFPAYSKYMNPVGEGSSIAHAQPTIRSVH